MTHLSNLIHISILSVVTVMLFMPFVPSQIIYCINCYALFFSILLPILILPPIFLSSFLLSFLLFFKRESARERVWGGRMSEERGRGRETESLKQAPCSVLRGTWGLIPWPCHHDLSLRASTAWAVEATWFSASLCLSWWRYFWRLKASYFYGVSLNLGFFDVSS